MPLSTYFPGDKLDEEWSVYDVENLVGHRCHGGRTYWVWKPKGLHYDCPACKSGMPQHLIFISRALVP